MFFEFFFRSAYKNKTFSFICFENDEYYIHVRVLEKFCTYDNKTPGLE